jgi:hypothetical protein
VERDAWLVVHGLRDHGSRGQVYGEGKVGGEGFVNWVFIVFLGFDLASWFPGQEVARDGGGGHDCASLNKEERARLDRNKIQSRWPCAVVAWKD